MSWPRPSRAVEHEKNSGEENIKNIFQERHEDQTIISPTP
jgi:hypothetical protein